MLILAHELGHIISVKILRVPIYEINFGAMSIDIPKPPLYHRKSFNHKMVIILSGSGLNFLIFMFFAGIYIITGKEFMALIAFQSLVIGVINILPIESLDGGEALNLVLHRYFSRESSKKISNILSLIFLVAVSFLGVFLVIKARHNISIIMFVIYLIFEKYFDMNFI